MYITKLDDLDKIREQFFYPDNFSIIFALAVTVGVIAGLILRFIRKGHTRWFLGILNGKLFFRFYQRNSDKEKLVVNIITKTNYEYSGIIDHVTEHTGGDILLNALYFEKMIVLNKLKLVRLY